MAETASPHTGTSPVASLSTFAGAVTLVEGQSFCVSGRAGNMSPDFPHGLFVLDARVLSTWHLKLNGHEIEPLAVDTNKPFAATFVGRGAPPPGQADADLVVFRHRHVGLGMRESIVVKNYGLVPARVELELSCAADFADLHAVKECRVKPAGDTRSAVEGGSLRIRAQGRGPSREVVIECDSDATVNPGAWGGVSKSDRPRSGRLALEFVRA